MKDYLFLLKQALEKNKKIGMPISEQQIAQIIGLDLVLHDLEKMCDDTNEFAIANGMVFFYPPNDAAPTCQIEFYKGKNLVIDNQNAFSEITNLDEIILQLIRIFSKCLDEKIVLSPYYFMLRLEGKIKLDYIGEARLLITEKVIKNKLLNKNNFDDATKYFINRFLDHFIALNFGLSINRNEQVKTELDNLNQKVIEMGIRDYLEPGVENTCSNTVMHYTYSPEKELVEKWQKKIK